jgi:pimeloyl-ACP methyl ester carboxylesterase
MTPFHFGPPARPLFGVYHAPNGRAPDGRAVLLCNPFGQEAIRIHRFYRLLAERLSRQGMAVLRFDYHGTGDAPGEDEDADLLGWAEDVRVAHRELLRTSGAMHATWFGARLGAAVALAAAPKASPMVQRLVLWDAVLDGPAYLESLRHAHVDELELSHAIPDPDWRRALARDPEAFTTECLGFAIPPKLRQQVVALNPETPGALTSQPITLIARPQDSAAHRWQQAVAGKHPGARISARPFDHTLVWTSNGSANNDLVPVEALQTMHGEIHGRT